MSLQRFTVRLTPRSAFATPLRGDLLFGQLVWSLRHALGKVALGQLLEGYTNHQPFAVIGDPLFAGYLPRPHMPLALLGFDTSNPETRKQTKGQRWIAPTALSQALPDWHEHARSEAELAEDGGLPARQTLWQSQIRGHNSLDRRTGTTGSGNGFAPFERELLWFHPHLSFELPLLLDTARLSLELLQSLLTGIGQAGYGKEASSGAGKFELGEITPWQPATSLQANSWLTLAPSAPQGEHWQTKRSFYEIHVRFGRHGDAAVKSGKPWKNPLLLAETAALLTPQTFDASRLFIGQGLSGLSLALPETVHQGYAPVLPVLFPEKSA